MKIRTASLLFLALLLSSCLGYKVNPRKAYTKALKNKPYEVIIVPGVPFEEDKGRWDDVMKARVYWSLYLYENNFTENIIFSGSAVYTPFVEAKIMKMYAIELGIPEDRIFTDTLAEHSSENLYNSNRLARKLGFTKIAFATDPFQSGFLSPFSKSLKIKVDAIPIVWKILESMNLRERPDPVIDYKSAYRNNFEAITEREGPIKRFRGTQGMHVNPSVYEGQRRIIPRRKTR